MKRFMKNPFRERNTLSYLILALLSCISACFFRKDASIWMMLPIYPICVAVGCFLPIKRKFRGAFFLLMIAILNGVATTDRKELAVILICALAYFLLIELAVWFAREKKGLFIIGSAVAIGVCLLCNAFLFGDPFSALRARKTLDEYIHSTYDTQDGGIVFEGFRYDTESRLYTISAKTEALPNEKRNILLSGSVVIDHFKKELEYQQSEKSAWEISDLWRDAFPNDSFTVERLGIERSEDGKLLSAKDKTDYRPYTNYLVRLSGTSSYPTLIKKATQYTDLLCEANIPFGNMTFVGGNGVFFRISVTPSEKNGRYYTEMVPGIYALHGTNVPIRFAFDGIVLP